jgi:hypothetical protein
MNIGFSNMTLKPKGRITNGTCTISLTGESLHEQIKNKGNGYK